MRADTPIDSLSGRTVSTQRTGSAVTMSSTSNRDSSRTSSSAWSWPVSSSGRSLSSPFQSPRLPALAWRTSSTEPVIAGPQREPLQHLAVDAASDPLARLVDRQPLQPIDLRGWG